MTRKRILIGIAALALITALFYFYGGHQAPAGQSPLATIPPESLDTVANAFNAAKDDVRLLVLLSPT